MLSIFGVLILTSDLFRQGILEIDKTNSKIDMKKVVTFALCAAAVVSASAQKQAVSDAKKLVGKTDKIEEARSLIKGAMENPETANDPFTYFVAGNIEWEAYDKARTAQMINPEDPSVKPDQMIVQLLNGYDYYLKALPLDSLPNAKGQVKPKYSKDIANKLVSHVNDFFQAGANAFNAKMYYPEAYNAFMIFGDMQNLPVLAKTTLPVDDATRATAFFNAGLGAYSGNKVMDAADAFRKSRLAGYDQPEGYIYELACWQNLAQDEAKAAEAQAHIYDIAKAGNDKFGTAQPVFLNNLVNCLVADNKNDEAMALIGEQLAANPDNAGLYALRGYVNVRSGKDVEAEADYRKAASFEDADFDTLKNAARMMFKRGTEIWNEIDANTADATAKRQDVRKNYWDWANEVANRAAQKNPNDSDLNDILDSIEYVLTTYTF